MNPLNRKKPLTLLLLFGALLPLCACGTPAETASTDKQIIDQLVVVPRSIEELDRYSTDIVEVRIDKTEVITCRLPRAPEGVTDPSNEMYDANYTVSTAIVRTAWKGPLKAGDSIAITQPGDGKTVEYSNVIQNGGYLTKDGTYLLCLSRDSESWRHFNREYFGYETLTIVHVGQYRLNADSRIVAMAPEAETLFPDVHTLTDLHPRLKHVNAATGPLSPITVQSESNE